MTLSNSYNYPPITNSSIADIYPWNDRVYDHMGIFCMNLSRRKLESRIKKLLKVDHMFFLNSGRAALSIALRSCSLKKGDGVLITAFNCSAVIDAILDAELTPIFVDCTKTGAIDLNKASTIMSSKIKALIVTHIYGNIEDMKKITEFCKKNKLYCINDLAQPFEVFDTNKKNHQYGDCSIYSFGAEKHLYCLGGGAIVVNNAQLLPYLQHLTLDEVARYELIGILLKRWKYYAKFTFHSFFPQIIHFNPQKLSSDIIHPDSIDKKAMSTIQLWILHKKLLNYPLYIKRSKENISQYMKLIKNRAIINLTGNNMSLPLYLSIKINAKDRYAASAYLNDQGIASVWNYLPLYKYEAYKKYFRKSLPETEKLWKEVLSIGFRFPMSKDRVSNICEVLNRYSL